MFESYIYEYTYCLYIGEQCWMYISHWWPFWSRCIWHRPVVITPTIGIRLYMVNNGLAPCVARSWAAHYWHVLSSEIYGPHRREIKDCNHLKAMAPNTQNLLPWNEKYPQKIISHSPLNRYILAQWVCFILDIIILMIEIQDNRISLINFVSYYVNMRKWEKGISYVLKEWFVSRLWFVTDAHWIYISLTCNI